jgi:hypothetical protein
VLPYYIGRKKSRRKLRVSCTSIRDSSPQVAVYPSGSRQFACHACYVLPLTLIANLIPGRRKLARLAIFNVPQKPAKILRIALKVHGRGRGRAGPTPSTDAKQLPQENLARGNLSPARKAAAEDRANQRPAGRPSETVDRAEGDVNNSRPTGNSVAAALQRKNRLANCAPNVVNPST